MTPALSALTLSANNRRIRWAGILLLATILMLGLGLFFTGSERTPETAAVHSFDRAGVYTHDRATDAQPAAKPQALI